ncbi:hypothetical protein IFR05_013092 [Cadophora sp. M221]|nr:hypothetical protein IFR05_013092 [Cadophora sp. M221]
MAQPPWSEDENDVFRHYILPKSQYCKGIFNPTTGIGWKDLVPLMQAEMARLGFPDQRIYTEAILSQQYYKLFGARSLIRGEGDIPGSMAPLRSQPSSRPPPLTNRIRTPGRVRVRSGYVSRFTQTDPKEFTGLSADEALGVHANTEGQTNHDLGGGGGRSGRDDRKIRQQGYEIEDFYRNDSGDYGGRKRRHQEQEYVDTRSMGVNEYRKYNSAQCKVEEYLHHPSRTSTSAHQGSTPSNTATWGDDDFPAFEDSKPTRGFADNNAWREKPNITRGFVLDELESPDDSDYGIPRDPFPAPRKETEAEVKARLDSYEDEIRVENEERRKRRKTSLVEPRSYKAFVLDELDDFSDGEFDFIDKDPLRPRAEMDGTFDGHGGAPIEKGMFVDGVYQPLRRRGFSTRPGLDQDQAPLLDDAKSATHIRRQFTSPAHPVENTTQRDKSNKSKAPRGSENAPTKKNERKNTGLSPPKAPAVKISKRVPSKMTNKLPQVTSKHPIAYTNRPVQFFESVKLPPIPKKTGSAKPLAGKPTVVERGHNGNDGNTRGGHLGGNYAVGGPNSTHNQPAKNSPVKVEARDRPAEKRVNVEGTSHKISDVPAAVKRTFKIDEDRNIPDSFLAKNTIASAKATAGAVSTSTPTPPPACNLSSVKESIHEHAMTAKFSTLKSIVAGANTETRVEDAPSWAKAIAAQRGIKEASASASTRGGEGNGNGSQKSVSPKK